MWLLESARLTLQRFFIVSAAFARDSSRDTLPLLSSQYFNNFSGGGNFPLLSYLCFWACTGKIGGNRVKMDADVLLHLLAQSAVLGPVESLSGCICLCPSSPTAAQSFVMHVRWSDYSLLLFWECDTGATFLHVYRLALTAKPINSSYIANAVYFIHCTDS